jgi:hypothetical protein
MNLSSLFLNFSPCSSYARSVFEWDPNTPLVAAREIYRSDVTAMWPDSFGFDNKGNLLVLSNRLNRFIANPPIMSFTGDANFRIHSVIFNRIRKILNVSVLGG